MKKKKKPEQDDKKQSARFMEETARRVEENVGEEDFAKTCSEILRAKKPIKQKGK